MPSRLRISVVGAGRLGSALSRKLRAAGYDIRQIVSRKGKLSRERARVLASKVGAEATTKADAPFDSDLIWLCVPDREISTVATALAEHARWKGKIVFHSSGVFGSRELTALRKKGAAIASVHPLMTFVHGYDSTLRDVPFAIEGDAAATKLARQIVKRLGGNAFAVKQEKKDAYHAFATFTSPLLIALLVAAEQVAVAAGISAKDARRKMLPILRETIRNYESLGPARSFSGPFVRGDVETIGNHLLLLNKVPGAEQIYLALARLAIRRLPVKNRAGVKKALNAGST